MPHHRSPALVSALAAALALSAALSAASVLTLDASSPSSPARDTAVSPSDGAAQGHDAGTLALASQLRSLFETADAAPTYDAKIAAHRQAVDAMTAAVAAPVREAYPPLYSTWLAGNAGGDGARSIGGDVGARGVDGGNDVLGIAAVAEGASRGRLARTWTSAADLGALTASYMHSTALFGAPARRLSGIDGPISPARNPAPGRLGEPIADARIAAATAQAATVRRNELLSSAHRMLSHSLQAALSDISGIDTGSAAAAAPNATARAVLPRIAGLEEAEYHARVAVAVDPWSPTAYQQLQSTLYRQGVTVPASELLDVPSAQVLRTDRDSGAAGPAITPRAGDDACDGGSGAAGSGGGGDDDDGGGGGGGGGACSAARWRYNEPLASSASADMALRTLVNIGRQSYSWGVAQAVAHGDSPFEIGTLGSDLAGPAAGVDVTADSASRVAAAWPVSSCVFDFVSDALPTVPRVLPAPPMIAAATATAAARAAHSAAGTAYAQHVVDAAVRRRTPLAQRVQWDPSCLQYSATELYYLAYVDDGEPPAAGVAAASVAVDSMHRRALPFVNHVAPHLRPLYADDAGADPVVPAPRDADSAVSGVAASDTASDAGTHTSDDRRATRRVSFGRVQAGSATDTALRSLADTATPLRVAFVSSKLTVVHPITKSFGSIVARVGGFAELNVTVFAMRPPTGADLAPVIAAARDAGNVTVVSLEGVAVDGIRAAIAAAAPHVVVFTDIGMHRAVSVIAKSRLAPVQAAMWGHPVTTGIATIDAYVGSDIEGAGVAATQYSEPWVHRLRSTGIHFKRPNAPTGKDLRTRAHFGLPADAHVYLVPQALFKVSPRMDALFEDILARDPKGLVVLFSTAGLPELALQLSARLDATIGRRAAAATAAAGRASATASDDAARGDIRRRIVILPRRRAIPVPDLPAHGFTAADAWRVLSSPAAGDVAVVYDMTNNFKSLLLCADVVLDTMPFGGGTTSLEALALGIPIVTLPGATLRGRQTLKYYRTLGVFDLVARTEDEYVALAVAMGTDGVARADVSARITAAAAVQPLFDDQGAVTEWRSFLMAAGAHSRRVARAALEAQGGVGVTRGGDTGDAAHVGGGHTGVGGGSDAGDDATGLASAIEWALSGVGRDSLVISCSYGDGNGGGNGNGDGDGDGDSEAVASVDASRGAADDARRAAARLTASRTAERRIASATSQLASLAPHRTWYATPEATDVTQCGRTLRHLHVHSGSLHGGVRLATNASRAPNGRGACADGSEGNRWSKPKQRAGTVAATCDGGKACRVRHPPAIAALGDIGALPLRRGVAAAVIDAGGCIARSGDPAAALRHVRGLMHAGARLVVAVPSASDGAVVTPHGLVRVLQELAFETPRVAVARATGCSGGGGGRGGGGTCAVVAAHVLGPADAHGSSADADSSLPPSPPPAVSLVDMWATASTLADAFPPQSAPRGLSRSLVRLRSAPDAAGNADVESMDDVPATKLRSAVLSSGYASLHDQDISTVSAVAVGSGTPCHSGGGGGGTGGDGGDGGDDGSGGCGGTALWSFRDADTMAPLVLVDVPRYFLYDNPWLRAMLPNGTADGGGRDGGDNGRDGDGDGGTAVTSRILDVGCASGEIALRTMLARPGTVVDCIEPQRQAAARARTLLAAVSQGRSHVWQGLLEDVSHLLRDGTYDAIYFADVLEHMVDPSAALQLVKPKLRRGGAVVASIPNVRNWNEVLQPLIVNAGWEYREQGILDRTHLRFFTLGSMRDMFTAAGYAVTSEDHIPWAQPGVHGEGRGYDPPEAFRDAVAALMSAGDGGSGGDSDVDAAMADMSTRNYILVGTPV